MGGGQGPLAIRSHVDVCDDRLLAVEALLHVREKVKPYLDLQLVAFPQDGGLLRSPGALANFRSVRWTWASMWSAQFSTSPTHF